MIPYFFLNQIIVVLIFNNYSFLIKCTFYLIISSK